MVNNPRLNVDVVGAHNLMLKDGEESSSIYLKLEFDRQKSCTTSKEKDTNPVWNESFYFNINDISKLQDLVLNAYVYQHVKGALLQSILGKVQLTGNSFVPYSEAAVLNYPLEKCGFMESQESLVTGELELKVYVTDDPSIKSLNPRTNHLDQVHQQQAPSPIPNDMTEARHTFRRQGYQELPTSQQPSYYNNTDFMYSSSSAQPVDYMLKETSPFLGGGQVVGGRVIRSDKPSSAISLVEKMLFLFVRVVKAHDLPAVDITGSIDPYVEVRIGNYRFTTKHLEKKQNPKWNEVFALSREKIRASVLEVVVKDKDFAGDDFVGIVRFNLQEIPTRVPPDSPLALEWYRLEDHKRERSKSELLLAVWIGTQADEAYPEAWHPEAAASLDIRSKVYHAPILWYVRINVIEAQDLIPTEKKHLPDIYVKAQIGNQVQKTKAIPTKLNPIWNEDLIFVVAEPFEDHLAVTVVEKTAHDKEDIMGEVFISLNSVEKRPDDRTINTSWFSLDKPDVVGVDQSMKQIFTSRIQLRVSLDGGYHVFEESTYYSSDLRPTARQLWEPSIGVLNLGILEVEGLQLTKTREGKGTSDTYCVVKYGRKWVRTRTIINSLRPKYNEQYRWEVYDPATVLTIGVFNNAQLGVVSSSPRRDTKIGKVRIRISTLKTGHVYTHSYPLLVLQPSGVKKMGVLHLAIHFSCTSLVNRMYKYSRPLLPKMHYIRPLTVVETDTLRDQAVNLVVARLSRAEPPLRREVVEYISDVDSHILSMRRSKAKIFRVKSVFAILLSVSKWFGDACMWKYPLTTVVMHVLFVTLVCFPELILPTVFLYMFVIGIWNFRYRPHYPPHMNIRISCAEEVLPDELDEEFDTFPTSQSPDLVRMRYDRLRRVAGRIQTVVGDIATQGERMLALLSWREPMATLIFVTFCLAAVLVLYSTPHQVVVIISGFYFMRHPRLRQNKLPSIITNFFHRLPTRDDSML